MACEALATVAGQAMLSRWGRELSRTHRRLTGRTRGRRGEEDVLARDELPELRVERRIVGGHGRTPIGQGSLAPFSGKSKQQLSGYGSSS